MLRPWVQLLEGSSIIWLVLKAIHLALLGLLRKVAMAGLYVCVLPVYTTALSCLRFWGPSVLVLSWD